MNAVRKFTVLCLMLLIASLTYASSYSNDVFVLVDVSGTMKDSQTNTEAKSIIQEILLGEFDYSKWQNKGWSKSNSKDEIPTGGILNQGSRFCMIPFGDMNRIQNNSKLIFRGKDEFIRFYTSSFPSVFRDSWTYLTLAKAYVGAIAVNDNIERAYVFIYTDGRPESTNQPYSTYDLHLVDELEHAGSNGFKKVGILRKTNANMHYDVEIWEFTSYKPGDVLEVTASDMMYTGSEIETQVIVTCNSKKLSLDTDYKILSGEKGVEKGQYTVNIEGVGTYSGRRSSAVWSIIDNLDSGKKKIQIKEPSEGRNKNAPYEVYKGQELTIRWSGGAGSVNVYTKDGNNYKLIPKNKRNEYYAQTISGTTAKLTFFESADYKIEVRGTNGGCDAMFLSVTTPILPILLKLLLVVGLIVGGVYAYNKFFRPESKHGPDENGWEGNNRTRQPDSHTSSGNDDW